jgi:hypothetical protein
MLTMLSRNSLVTTLHRDADGRREAVDSHW